MNPTYIGLGAAKLCISVANQVCQGSSSDKLQAHKTMHTLSIL